MVRKFITQPTLSRLVFFGVNLSGTPVMDADLHRLNSLAPRLTRLDLSMTKVDGSGLPELNGLCGGKSIELSLRGTKVPQENLGRFLKGASVSILDLSDTGMTDSGIEVLLEARSMADLDLSNTKVSGVGLGRVKTLALRGLYLHCLPLTDDDVPTLVELEKTLFDLDVSGTALSQEGISRLRAGLRIGAELITTAEASDRARSYLREHISAP